MGDDVIWWIVGGVVAAAGVLVFVFKDQICQNMPDIPLLCKPITGGGPEQPQLSSTERTLSDEQLDSVVAPIVEKCKSQCSGYLVGSSGWESCMKSCSEAGVMQHAGP